MATFRTKKISLILIIVLGVLATIVMGIYFARNKYISSENDAATVFAQDVRYFVIEATNSALPNERIEKELAKLRDKSLSDQEKFDALSTLAFYFADEYATTHDPKVREFSSTVLAKYAKEKFPKHYNESMFNFVCADLTCGQKLSPELNQIIKLVKESKAEPDYKNTIISNLTNVGYIPDSETDEKMYGFSFIYPQMLELGDPKASEAAALLKKYAKQKYNLGL